MAAPQAYLNRCMGGTIYGDYIGDSKCWPFAKSRLRGVLDIGFEFSSFHPGATRYGQGSPGPKVWFESDAPTPAVLRDASEGVPHAYLVDAEGQMSQCDAWFGHLGQYPREFIVTKFYSVTPLPMR